MVSEKDALLGRSYPGSRNQQDLVEDVPSISSEGRHRRDSSPEGAAGSHGGGGAVGGAANNVMYGTVQEVPPLSYVSVTGEPPTITCKVCEEQIDISAKRDQHVVKCQRCGEATPIKHAPPGRKYVRCQCKCLLICKTTSSRIACPRAGCDVVINFLPAEPPSVNPISTPNGHSRVQCAYCRDTFLFDAVNNAFAHCPHCTRISAITSSFRKRGGVYLVAGSILLILSIVVTASSATLAREKGGLYFLYIVLFLASVALMLRGGYFLALRRSHIYSDGQGFAGNSRSSLRGGFNAVV